MIYLTVELTATPGMRAECLEYERIALGIFREYGGEVLAAFRPANEEGAHPPDEVQVLRIASRERLAAFVADERRQALADVRARVIRLTRTLVSGELIEY